MLWMKPVNRIQPRKHNRWDVDRGQLFVGQAGEVWTALRCKRTRPCPHGPGERHGVHREELSLLLRKTLELAGPIEKVPLASDSFDDSGHALLFGCLSRFQQSSLRD